MTEPIKRTVKLIKWNPSTIIVETPKYWLLFSYETLIAYDDKATNIISFSSKNHLGMPYGTTTIKALNAFLGHKRWQKAVMDGTAKEVSQEVLEAML